MERKIKELKDQYNGFWGFCKRIGRAIAGVVVSAIGLVVLPFTSKVLECGVNLITFNDPEKFEYQNCIDGLDASDSQYVEAE